jgi:hypothetical protein
VVGVFNRPSMAFINGGINGGETEALNSINEGTNGRRGCSVQVAHRFGSMAQS